LIGKPGEVPEATGAIPTSGKVVVLLETIWRRGRFGLRPARRSSPPIYVAPDVEEETMTITDPLTAQVANLHGMAGDIQSA
jgi:hypothetical protein